MIHRVHTQTGSAYDLDLDNKLARRTPGRSGAALRLDCEWVSLVILPKPPALGSPLVLPLRVRDDGVVTLRTTSPVTKIETLSEREIAK